METIIIDVMYKLLIFYVYMFSLILHKINILQQI